MVIISQDGKEAFFVGDGMRLSVMGRYLFLDSVNGPDRARDARIGEFGNEKEAMGELMRLAALYARNETHTPHRVSRGKED